MGGSDGIRLWKSSNNIISENVISKNNNGIYTEYSSNNYIIGNNISNNLGHGICLSDFSSYNIICGNDIHSNGGGIALLFESSNCNITNNVVRNNDEEAIYIHTSSRYNTISDNIIEENGGIGILLDLWCSNSVISNNIIINNNRKHRNDNGGIGIGTSNNIVISGNVIKYNYGRTEICLYHSKGIVISDNHIESFGHLYALDHPCPLIHLWASHDILITRNNIINKATIWEKKKDVYFNIGTSGSFKEFLKAFKKAFTNKFIGNYWGRFRILPKPIILGRVFWTPSPLIPTLTFPCIVFDPCPAKKPYKIHKTDKV